MTAVSRASLWMAGTGLLLMATACSQPTITAFTITSNPSISIAPGGSAVMTVAATTASSSAQTATIIIYNLPAGVSYSPASPTVTTGSQTDVTLTAAPNAPASTAQVQVVGAAGLAGSTVYVPVTVAP